MMIRWRKPAIWLLVIAVVAFFPLLVKYEYITSLLITLFIYISIAESWNLLGGYTGQISLGHSAFFGLGALGARLLWVANVPIVAAVILGGVSSALLAAVVGVPCLRMRSAYFPIGTLALSMIALLTVANLFPIPGALPKNFLDAYDIFSRYYLGMAVALLTMLIVYWIVNSRTGLAVVAIRDNEQAAMAMGVRTLRYKVLSVVLSSFLAGLGGGVYAYQHVSYYYDTPFDLIWSFTPTLTTFIGGLGTILGPVLGSVCFLLLSELFAVTLGEVHVLIFGLSFILIVLFLPGGLMSIKDMLLYRSNGR
ncbi:MAG: branched-chain amino acid ABC transporter permease [Deltaproteobacteria bacterium]|nr:branched-chain amino acid ABC transporter permease [Deltaproteobacteria bacterium]MBW2065861.1 branched-chain amino acid ABC transporter permease [Deltaproteobacteria bacterium]